MDADYVIFFQIAEDGFTPISNDANGSAIYPTTTFSISQNIDLEYFLTMSNLYLANFINPERPDLQCPSVNELPTEDMDAESLLKLEASLKVDSSHLVACCRSARLWESLLEEYRLPFLLLRVADMRTVLDSRATALELYEELQNILQNAFLQGWISQARYNLNIEIQSKLRSHNSPTNPSFTPSQRWRSSIEHDRTFPYCNIQERELTNLRERWKIGANNLRERFFNFHCLETNFLEDIFQFSPNTADQLLDKGFDIEMSFTPNDIINGEMRDPSEALSILRDTREALDAIYQLFSSDPVELTVDVICKLHKMVMRTSRILCLQKSRFYRINYTNSGVTRQRSCVNVVIRSGKLTIQFCPHDQVDKELDVFCGRLKTLLQQKDMDPFAAAAWINHVFTAIHPFEDGNGRVSRLLSSIPLIRSDLPPLCILASGKDSYVTELNKIRSLRNGDFEELMVNFYKNTVMSLDLMEGK